MLGAVSAISVSHRCFVFIWKYFLRQFPAIKKHYSGSWAVITGATAGIGLEMARTLVKEGVNVVLIARDKNELSRISDELRTLNSDVSVHIISCDCASPDYNFLFNLLQDLDISILVNNVGVHNDIPTNVSDMNSSEIERIISVNCLFQVQFTSLLIPILKRRASPKKSLILNVSSLTSQMVMPMLSVYAATKVRFARCKSSIKLLLWSMICCTHLYVFCLLSSLLATHPILRHSMITSH